MITCYVIIGLGGHSLCLIRNAFPRMAEYWHPPYIRKAPRAFPLRSRAAPQTYKTTRMDAPTLSLLAIVALVVFIWVLPIISIVSSRKTTGSEKLAWILAVLFISWFAWIFYLLLAPVKKK